ncbi:hypothetical protein LINGRAHAP2_LOCUS12990 [Linum grandiflorum]
MSIFESRALFAAVLAVTVLLLSTAQPSTSAKPAPLVKYTGHIVNYRSFKVLEIKCNSSKGEKVEEFVIVDHELEWSFKADAKTSWKCHVAANNQHKDFVAFGPDAEWQPAVDAHNNFYWRAEDRGIFSFNSETGSDTLAYWWDEGGI